MKDGKVENVWRWEIVIENMWMWKMRLRMFGYGRK
jgi:hypothetical protein